MNFKYFIFISLVLFTSCTNNTPLSFKGIYLGCPQNEIEKIVSQDNSISNFNIHDSYSQGQQDYDFDTYIIGDNDEKFKGISTIRIKEQKVYSISFYINLDFAQNDAINILPNIYNLYKKKYGKYDKKYGKAQKDGTNYIWEWENQRLTIQCRSRDRSWKKILKSEGYDVDNFDISKQLALNGNNDIWILYETVSQEEIETEKKIKQQNQIENDKIKKAEKEQKEAIKKMKENQDI